MQKGAYAEVALEPGPGHEARARGDNHGGLRVEQRARRGVLQVPRVPRDPSPIHYTSPKFNTSILRESNLDNSKKTFLQNIRTLQKNEIYTNLSNRNYGLR